MDNDRQMRVLYSFPHKLGAERICHTAWQQVNGLAAAGAKVIVYPGVLHRPLPQNIEVTPTLAWGKMRVSYKMLGTIRACALHDWIAARRLESRADDIDIVHTWPLASRRTIRVARRLGIPTVLERTNTHTRFAYEVVQRECDRLGVTLPRDHETAYNADVLRIEEEEYELSDYLLCPSDFVVRSFLDKGFPKEKLVRHSYGFDDTIYHPSSNERSPRPGLTMLFAGVCAVRKGLHFALEAWLRSPAHRTGTFLIAGEFLPSYRLKLDPMLKHPSIQVLGHRNDVPELMRGSDILVLPSIEEGSALVCTEALGTGCVPLVSEAASGHCRHNENALVHRVGDVEALTQHITLIHNDRKLLKRLRESGLECAKGLTWAAAGRSLFDIYRTVLAGTPPQSVVSAG